MSIMETIDAFSAKVEEGDFEGFGNLFTEDGVYHDIFYGEFKGPQAIADMLRLFHKGGKDFKWEFFDLAQGDWPEGDFLGYGRWMFSYTAIHERAEGKRITFDGVGIFYVRDGKIARYEDSSNGAVPLRQMNTPPELMDKMLARWQGWLEDRPQYAGHQK